MYGPTFFGKKYNLTRLFENSWWLDTSLIVSWQLSIPSNISKLLHFFAELIIDLTHSSKNFVFL
jgi:hypothetical protein